MLKTIGFLIAMAVLLVGCDQIPQSHRTADGKACTSLGPPWAQVWVTPDRMRAC
jgi:hypothetical protein